MKISIDNLHKAFDSRIRLGIMAALAASDSLDFVSLKEFLDLTDGNLASHIKALEKEEFIGIKKSFIDRKPNTKYFITRSGKIAFNNHLKALEKIIQSNK
ncbi:MAG: transcriptional regulator [Saprospiraceae bacterium]|nr:transcriptional regulator [Saprospiraceae bacterium]MBK7812582.1 transcriptional regulator [Saprospiraceae bacterium]MBK9630773.1 transcriptional regulator [Saprospiraceae bacterium]